MHFSTPAHVTEYLWQRLDRQNAGQVLMAHSSGVYLQFGREVFLLCDSSWGILPIGITVDRFRETVLALQICTGQPVLRKNRDLIFPGGRLQLSLLPEPAQLPCYPGPRPEMIRQAAEELAALEKSTGLSMLVLPLILGRACDPALPENPYFSRAFQKLDALINAIEQNDFDRIEENTAALLGLGSGLTPSADDVLLGMLYVFCRLHRGDLLGIARLQVSVFHLCSTHTNQISAAYLKAVLHGAPFERMETVFGALCAEQPLKIESLTQIGSNSGSEMLLGMLIGSHIYRNHMSNKEESQ